MNARSREPSPHPPPSPRSPGARLRSSHQRSLSGAPHRVVPGGAGHGVGVLRKASTSQTRPNPFSNPHPYRGLGPALLPFSAYLARLTPPGLPTASEAGHRDRDGAGPYGALPSSQARPGARLPPRGARPRRRSFRPCIPLRQRESVANGLLRIRVTQSSGGGGLISSGLLSGVGVRLRGSALGRWPGVTDVLGGTNLERRGERAACSGVGHWNIGVYGLGEANAVLPRAGWPRARGCGEGEGRLTLWPPVERLRWRSASAGARGVLSGGAGSRGAENLGRPGLGGLRAGGAARVEPTLLCQVHTLRLRCCQVPKPCCIRCRGGLPFGMRGWCFVAGPRFLFSNFYRHFSVYL